MCSQTFPVFVCSSTFIVLDGWCYLSSVDTQLAVDLLLHVHRCRYTQLTVSTSHPRNVLSTVTVVVAHNSAAGVQTKPSFQALAVLLDRYGTLHCSVFMMQLKFYATVMWSVLKSDWCCQPHGSGSRASCKAIFNERPELQKQVGCLNHRVVTMVADKLKRLWLWEAFGISG